MCNKCPDYPSSRISKEYLVPCDVYWTFFIAYMVKAEVPLITDLSWRRLKYQSCKNLQRQPTSAEYELHKNLRVSWDYQLHKPLLTNGCRWWVTSTRLSTPAILRDGPMECASITKIIRLSWTSRTSMEICPGRHPRSSSLDSQQRT